MKELPAGTIFAMILFLYVVVMNIKHWIKRRKT